jgi:hypothetical protein
MNDIAFILEYVVAEEGGLPSTDAGQLNRDLRRRLHSRGGYTTLLDLVARRLAEHDGYCELAHF